MSAYAGPFVKEDFLKLIPLDKKLDPAWVASLTARGEPETFTGEALERIGMPVGGMFTGTLYLGGDGRLWLWDIFNNYRLGIEPNGTTHLGQPMNAIWGSSYIAPLHAKNYRLVEQGFALTVKSAAGEVRRTLDAEKGRGFGDVSFTGEYPIGVVRYADADVPVKVRLEAFSPFSPLEVKDSSLPATIFSFELTNTGKEAVEVTLEGVLENAVFHDHRFLGGIKRSATRDIAGATLVDLTATMDPEASGKNPDVVLEDWSKPTFADAGWTVEGDAFGKGPIPRDKLPAYMGDVGGDTLNVANSHAGNHFTERADRDGATGKLISKPFTIDRNFLCFWIGGGSDPSKLGLSLLIDGKIVHNATGVNANRMVTQSFDVSAHKGKEARLEIYDQKTAEWAQHRSRQDLAQRQWLAHHRATQAHAGFRFDGARFAWSSRRSAWSGSGNENQREAHWQARPRADLAARKIRGREFYHRLALPACETDDPRPSCGVSRPPIQKAIRRCRRGRRACGGAFQPSFIADPPVARHMV
jgi:non-lysosomal glucosylceramidase